MKHKHILNTFYLIILLAIVSGCSSSPQKKDILIFPSSESTLAQAKSVIQSSASSSDPYIKTYAMEGLVKLESVVSDKLIVQSLSSEIVAVQVSAAIAAGDRKIESARAKLEEMITSSNVMVKLSAGYALEKLGDKRFLKWYDKALFSDIEKYAGQSCLLLGKLGDTPLRSNSRQTLNMVMSKPGQKPYIRLQAAEALARLGDNTIKERLLDFAGSGYADDRLLTISALKLLGCNECYAVLSVLASDDQIEVQLSALRALGSLAGEEDRAPAYTALDYIDPYNDDNVTERVKHLAILAIGSFGLNNDSAILGSYLSSENEFIRLSAAIALIDWQKARQIRQQQ